jgi:hypothetical protein
MTCLLSSMGLEPTLLPGFLPKFSPTDSAGRTALHVSRSTITSPPIRDQGEDYLITPKNAALLIIDYQPP